MRRARRRCRRARGNSTGLPVCRGAQPVLRHRLGLLVADERPGEDGRVGRAAPHLVLRAARVDEVADALLALDVEDFAVALRALLAVRAAEVPFGEDEGGLLHAGALAAARLDAHRPPLRLGRLRRAGQPVGGVRDAEDRAAGRLAGVQDVVADLDDVELAGVQQQPGRRQVQHRMQQRLPVLALAGRQHDVPGRGLLADDDLGAGRVPALGRLGFEHAPGAEPRPARGRRRSARAAPPAAAAAPPPPCRRARVGGMRPPCASSRRCTR